MLLLFQYHSCEQLSSDGNPYWLDGNPCTSRTVMNCSVLGGFLPGLLPNFDETRWASQRCAEVGTDSQRDLFFRFEAAALPGALGMCSVQTRCVLLWCLYTCLKHDESTVKQVLADTNIDISLHIYPYISLYMYMCKYATVPRKPITKQQITRWIMWWTCEVEWQNRHSHIWSDAGSLRKSIAVAAWPERC